MRKIDFTDDDIIRLQHEQEHNPSPKARKKCLVLLLICKGLPQKLIRDIGQISSGTLHTYTHLFLDHGVKGLIENRHKGKKNELMDHAEEFKDIFEKNPPKTLKEARQQIIELSGITRSIPQVRVFLKRLGLKRRKAGFVPGKMDTQEKIKEQETFVSQELTPRIEEAKAGKRDLYFMDAAHFIHSVYLGMLWCLKRVFIPSPSGRKRFNILGAVNIITRQIVSINNDITINAASVCELLAKLSRHRCEEMPITVVLDNARYQRCSVVQEYAQEVGIELLFLPSYSPNLNLIERVWKWVKKKSLHTCYYEKFTAFKEGIMSSFENLSTEKIQELETLVTCKFQRFSKLQLSA